MASPQLEGLSRASSAPTTFSKLCQAFESDLEKLSSQLQQILESLLAMYKEDARPTTNISLVSEYAKGERRIVEFCLAKLVELHRAAVPFPEAVHMVVEEVKMIEYNDKWDDAEFLATVTSPVLPPPNYEALRQQNHSSTPADPSPFLPLIPQSPPQQIPPAGRIRAAITTVGKFFLAIASGSTIIRWEVGVLGLVLVAFAVLFIIIWVLRKGITFILAYFKTSVDEILKSFGYNIIVGILWSITKVFLPMIEEATPFVKNATAKFLKAVTFLTALSGVSQPGLPRNTTNATRTIYNGFIQVSDNIFLLSNLAPNVSVIPHLLTRSKQNLLGASATVAHMPLMVNKRRLVIEYDKLVVQIEDLKQVTRRYNLGVEYFIPQFEYLLLEALLHVQGIRAPLPASIQMYQASLSTACILAWYNDPSIADRYTIFGPGCFFLTATTSIMSTCFNDAMQLSPDSLCYSLLANAPRMEAYLESNMVQAIEDKVRVVRELRQFVAFLRNEVGQLYRNADRGYELCLGIEASFQQIRRDLKANQDQMTLKAKVINGRNRGLWFHWFWLSSKDSETDIILTHYLEKINRSIYLHEAATIVFREVRGLLDNWKDGLDRIETGLNTFEDLTDPKGKESREHWKDWAVLKYDFDYHLRPVLQTLEKTQVDMISNTKAVIQRLDRTGKECHQEAQLRIRQGLQPVTWEECYNRKLGTPM